MLLATAAFRGFFYSFPREHPSENIIIAQTHVRGMHMSSSAFLFATRINGRGALSTKSLGQTRLRHSSGVRPGAVRLRAAALNGSNF